MDKRGCSAVTVRYVYCTKERVCMYTDGKRERQTQNQKQMFNSTMLRAFIDKETRDGRCPTIFALAP